MIKRQPEGGDSHGRQNKPAAGKKAEGNRFDEHGGTKCECCGNEYDKPLEIVINGISHYFDSFECAIHKLAPRCAHCECRIIGHGVESGGQMFCCANCAHHAGIPELKDRA